MQLHTLARDRLLLEATIERLIALLDAIDAPFTDLEAGDDDQAVDDEPCDEPNQDMEPDDEDSGIDDVPHDDIYALAEPGEEFRA